MVDRLHMYKYNNQCSLFDSPEHFVGVDLDPNNRWVILSTLMPWADIEERYAESFKGKKTGQIAKPARMSFISELIKKKLGLSDIELVEMITEIPYLQYFIGMKEFSTKPPFDPSTLTYFRRRLSPGIIDEINDHAIDEHNRNKPQGQVWRCRHRERWHGNQRQIEEQGHACGR